MSADNLASQLIGGYKCLASALRKCRFCMAIDQDMQSKVHMNFNVCSVVTDLTPSSRQMNLRHVLVKLMLITYKIYRDLFIAILLQRMVYHLIQY